MIIINEKNLNLKDILQYLKINGLFDDFISKFYTKNIYYGDMLIDSRDKYMSYNFDKERFESEKYKELITSLEKLPLEKLNEIINDYLKKAIKDNISKCDIDKIIELYEYLLKNNLMDDLESRIYKERKITKIEKTENNNKVYANVYYKDIYYFDDIEIYSIERKEYHICNKKHDGTFDCPIKEKQEEKIYSIDTLNLLLISNKSSIQSIKEKYVNHSLEQKPKIILFKKITKEKATKTYVKNKKISQELQLKRLKLYNYIIKNNLAEKIQDVLKEERKILEEKIVDNPNWFSYKKVQCEEAYYLDGEKLCSIIKPVTIKDIYSRETIEEMKDIPLEMHRKEVIIFNLNEFIFNLDEAAIDKVLEKFHINFTETSLSEEIEELIKKYCILSRKTYSTTKSNYISSENSKTIRKEDVIYKLGCMGAFEILSKYITVYEKEKGVDRKMDEPHFTSDGYLNRGSEWLDEEKIYFDVTYYIGNEIIHKDIKYEIYCAIDIITEERPIIRPKFELWPKSFEYLLKKLPEEKFVEVLLKLKGCLEKEVYKLELLNKIEDSPLLNKILKKVEHERYVTGINQIKKSEKHNGYFEMELTLYNSYLVDGKEFHVEIEKIIFDEGDYKNEEECMPKLQEGKIELNKNKISDLLKKLSDDEFYELIDALIYNQAQTMQPQLTLK